MKLTFRAVILLFLSSTHSSMHVVRYKIYYEWKTNEFNALLWPYTQQEGCKWEIIWMEMEIKLLCM